MDVNNLTEEQLDTPALEAKKLNYLPAMLKRNNIYLQSYLKNDQLQTYIGKMQEQNKYNMSSCAVYQSTVVTKKSDFFLC